MAKHMFVAMAAALALAGCGGGTAHKEAANVAADNADNMAAENVSAGSNMQAEVMNLSPQQQKVVFIRAILDAGQPCDGVVKAEPTTSESGNPTWRAQCSNGVWHLISIGKDGTAQVMSRTDQ